MKNRAFDASAHPFAAGERILPDANFWIYLLGPGAVPGNALTATYSSVFGQLLTANTELFLDVLVLSEFVNTYVAAEHKRLPKKTDRKKWRNSPAFVPVAKTIETQAKQILALTKPLDHPFASWDLVSLFSDYSAGGRDVNDQLLAETCRHHQLSFLTHDGDCTEGGITVYTANTDLLAACPP
jgi:predicted nucleic acid-binding protein